MIYQTVPDTLHDKKCLKLSAEAVPEKLSSRGEKQSLLNVFPPVKDGLKALWVICLRDLRYRPFAVWLLIDSLRQFFRLQSSFLPLTFRVMSFQPQQHRHVRIRGHRVLAIFHEAI